jgi:hypothetical protein
VLPFERHGGTVIVVARFIPGMIAIDARRNDCWSIERIRPDSRDHSERSAGNRDRLPGLTWRAVPVAPDGHRLGRSELRFSGGEVGDQPRVLHDRPDRRAATPGL